MVLKEIGSEIVFGKTMFQTEKLNYYRRLLRSQWNFEKIYIWHKKQPLSGFERKKKVYG